MFVRNEMPWLRLLFRFRGSSLEKTWLRILAATLIATVVTILEIQFGVKRYTLTTTPFVLIGVALGIFLGFRNNAAYDRFWEGRKLWGALVNTSRSLARQAYALFHLPAEQDGDATSSELDEFRHTFVKRVIAFVHSLRHHLRESDPLEEISPYLSNEDVAVVRDFSHRPLAILQQLGHDIAHARSRGWLHELNAPSVDAQLVELSNILGACERIKNTPIPFSYTLLIHRIVAFYCLFLPFGLVDTTGVLTPVVVFLISHAFFGLDTIGDEIEQPFGVEPNDLPLSAISRNIEINLLELIGESQRPEPLSAVDGILV